MSVKNYRRSKVGDLRVQGGNLPLLSPLSGLTKGVKVKVVTHF